jgi:hypothetical protein
MLPMRRFPIFSSIHALAAAVFRLAAGISLRLMREWWRLGPVLVADINGRNSALRARNVSQTFFYTGCPGFWAHRFQAILNSRRKRCR